jgi:16S rRNA (cytidine1402-2'-O)-methyltransferase
VPLIAAEDTRVTRRLLTKYEIATRVVSYHARSGPGRTAELLAHLRGGADLALTTDAGTPSVSDPGDELVTAFLDEGGRVVPIPGPSAVLAGVVASGVAGPRWAFEGFLPRSGRERRERLARIAADERATILFEAPSRLRATVTQLASACGPDRAAAVCRELTKLHEQVVRGSLEDLAAAVERGDIPSKGELVIVVAGQSLRDGALTMRVSPGLDAISDVEALVLSGVARGEAVRRVAVERGLRRRELYAATRGDRPTAG